MVLEHVKVGKRRVSRRAVAAQFAALCMVSSSVMAAVVESGPVNINVPNTFTGIYLNVVTGAVSTTAPVAGWDINAWGTGGNLTFFSSTTVGNVSAVVGAGGVVTPQALGATVGPASSFVTGTNGTAGTTFRQTGTSFLGIRFVNEAGTTTHYGYAEFSTTAPGGFPTTLVRYAYESTPDTAIVVSGGATAPQFSYTPTAGSTVGFTGGTTVGSTGNASIAVAVGTAGSGTGAAATTTTTCTAPTAPFSGFGQTVTAVGTGAATGGPLSGTCTLGNAEVTQTLTCSENRGGTATPVTFTLSCPAGTQPNLTSTPVSGTTITLPNRPLGSAATTAQISFGNPGGLPATVTCTAPANTAFTASPLTINVPAGGNASTTVSYTSTSVGTTTGSITCTSGAQTFNFGLSGTTLLPAPAFIPASNTWTLALLASILGLFAGVFVYRRQG